jgi:hypothetical protein
MEVHYVGGRNEFDGEAWRAQTSPGSALANAALSRGCSLASLGGWLEMEGGAALCRPVRNAPARLQGVAGVAHRARRSRLEFHVKAGNAGEVARLMDEGGEEAWLGWAPAAPPRMEGGSGGGGGGDGGVWRARRMRWQLFDLPCEAAQHDWPVWPPKGHDAAAEVLRLRAPEGRHWPISINGRTHFGPFIDGPLAAWRAANPDAEAANVVAGRDRKAAEYVHLAGVKVLNILARGQFFTDAVLAHLAGIHTLHMRWCEGISGAGLAPLVGIHTLDMSECRGITDAGLAHLAGIHTLNMESCTRITDAGLAHLAGIHTLDMRGCEEITDAGLAHLAGIHSLNMGGCKRVSDVGLAHLTGIHSLNMRGCTGVTGAGLSHLAGIRALNMHDCAPAAIAAARARGLPVIA